MARPVGDHWRLGPQALPPRSSSAEVGFCTAHDSRRRVALPPKVPDRAPGIGELLSANGFEEDVRGDDKPPATLYRLGKDTDGFYAEFLTPLMGGGLTRAGKRKVTVQVAGVTSQQLRYIDLLLHDPWLVHLDPGVFGIPDRRQVQVANPVSFMAQKLLIHKKRTPADRAKDILYVHDTLQVFGSRLDELRDDWTASVVRQLHPNAARTVVRAPNWLFAEVSDAIRQAASIPKDRRLTPEAVRESCRYGLRQVFT